MSKELECLDRIDKRNYLTKREHKEFLGVVEKALTEYEAIKNAEPTKTMECLETIWCDISTNYINEYVAIKQALQRLESIDKAVEICKKANEQKYVYIKETYGIIKEKFLDDLDYEVINNRLYVNSRGMYYDFPLKDYGNWWALTKEELE